MTLIDFFCKFKNLYMLFDCPCFFLSFCSVIYPLKNIHKVLGVSLFSFLSGGFSS